MGHFFKTLFWFVVNKPVVSAKPAADMFLLVSPPPFKFQTQQLAQEVRTCVQMNYALHPHWWWWAVSDFTLRHVTSFYSSCKNMLTAYFNDKKRPTETLIKLFKSSIRTIFSHISPPSNFFFLLVVNCLSCLLSIITHRFKASVTSSFLPVLSTLYMSAH